MYSSLAASLPVAASQHSSLSKELDVEAVAIALGAENKVEGVTNQSSDASNKERFVLLGILDGEYIQNALIATDGNPPRAVKIGGTVTEGWVLKSITPRIAIVSNGDRDTILSLPPIVGKDSPLIDGNDRISRWPIWTITSHGHPPATPIAPISRVGEQNPNFDQHTPADGNSPERDILPPMDGGEDPASPEN